jgi:hypothetical protein
LAGARGNQHTLACRRSIAARGLGLGMKGIGRWIIVGGDSIVFSVVIIVVA